jgi:hypothetical protein
MRFSLTENRWSLFIALAVILYICTWPFYNYWLNPFTWDTFGYYLYLPMSLIHNDLGISDFSILEEVKRERGNIEHHLNGLIFNKVPLLRKLKWREVGGVKGIWGKLNNASLMEMDLPAYTSTLQTKPYLEAFAGVENIFKVMRVDLMWRLNYLDNEFNGIKVNRLGIRSKLQFTF